MEKQSKIYVAGGETLIGAALLRQLQQQQYTNLISPHLEPPLTDGKLVAEFFAEHQPEYVFLAAGKSGGILANQRYPAELMLDNLLVECHIIQSAYSNGVKKLLYLASSCSYPKFAPQPIEVKSLLTGAIEPTNEAYAVAKIAGIKLCQAYRQQYRANFLSVIPANVFGPGDDFSSEGSHVIPALIRKMHDAKIANAQFIDIWGTGTPKRDFLFVEDLADACILTIREFDDCSVINIASGSGISIQELAELIKQVVGYLGELRFDTTKPDGMPLKILDTKKLQQMGWEPKTSLRDALKITFEWFLQTK